MQNLNLDVLFERPLIVIVITKFLFLFSVNFKTSNHFNSSISITNLEFVLDLVLSIDILFYPNTSLLVSLENRETRRIYNLYYIFADFSISVQDQNIYYGVGTKVKWNHLTRDLFVDLSKGMQLQHYFNDHKKKIRRTELKIVSMEFRGNGSFGKLRNYLKNSTFSLLKFFSF